MPRRSDDRSRPIIIGEAPSKSGDKYHLCPLSGAVGQRLAEWAGIEPDPEGTRYGRWYWPLVAAFDLHNLIERYPGPQGRGAALPMELALPAWEALLPTLEGRVVILLGSRLAQLASLARPYECWDVYEAGTTELSVQMCAIPHPSALNRAYNDPSTVELAKRVLREALMYAAL